MIKKSIIVLLVVITTKIATANAVTINQVDISPRVKTISEIIEEKSTKYGLDEKLVYDLIMCESTGNPLALNPHGEFSVGLSQINLEAHHNITRQQAEDPEFAVEFMTSNLAKGNWKMWYNCYKKVTS